MAKKKGQNDKQLSTKYTHKPKDRVTPTPQTTYSHTNPTDYL
jgi:hypothetical protein